MDEHAKPLESPTVSPHPKRTDWLLVIELVMLCVLLFTIWWIFQPSQLILGTWKDQASPTQMTFFSDGTVSETNSSLPASGDYRLLSSNQLRIDFGGLGGILGPWILTMTLSDSTLTLTDQAGHTTNFAKVGDASMAGVIRSWFGFVGNLILGRSLSGPSYGN